MKSEKKDIKIYKFLKGFLQGGQIPNFQFAVLIYNYVIQSQATFRLCGINSDIRFDKNKNFTA